MLDVNNQNSNITHTLTSWSKIAETLMAWGINDKKTWNLDLNIQNAFAFLNFLNQFGLWEESCSNLLGNTSCLSFLHISSSEFI